MVKKSIDVKVRPLANPSLEKASLLGAARLYVSRDSLIALTGALDNGHSCVVEKLGEDAAGTPGPDGTTPSGPIKREAALWVLPDKNVSPNVVMMSRAFQDATGFKIGDQVRLALAEAPTPEADEVAVVDVSEGSQEDPAPTRYTPSWEHSISLSLARAEQVFPGMVLEGVTINKLRRAFKVVSVNSQSHTLARFKLDSTAVRILQPGDETESPDGLVMSESRGDLVLANVPGLPTQVKTINAFLKGFTRPFWFPDRVSSRSCAFVIQGGHGTGKTFILQRIAETNWGKVHWITPLDKLTTIREIFKQAQTQQPCMILMDDLQELIAQDRSNRDALIETIGRDLDALADAGRTQNGLPHVLVLVTCSDYLTDVPQKLQTRSRLFKNVTLPIPRAPERLEILKFHDLPLRPEDKESCLADIAQRTHAYNCKDLFDLVKTARDIREEKLDDAGLDPAEAADQFVTREDMEQALRLIRPTAMHDINLQPPIIHWQDVGGQDSVKKVLSRMIKYAKETDPSIPRVITPSKGLLLYGPPGCSKTLSAQAMATESSFNFFAVKGAELLNMYVGESERAVRNLFNRARAASPSIIFFDEIDSIGGQRGPGGSAASKSSGSSVNMITTLLTEMDGFEALSGVLVIAATNRPESMDEALLRPGRFDEVVYVGPPDQAAREAIFHVHLRGKPLADDVDVARLAARADGHSGAEIKSICNQAAHTVQERYEDDETGTAKLEFTMEDLEAALLREPTRITPQMLAGYDRWSRQFREL